jgi:hypothetical protein
MTAREFLERYDVDLEKGLSALDRYLQGTATVKYAEFPDAELPEEFQEAADEPAGFDEFVADLEA